MGTSSTSTKDRLIDAGEQLFAAMGIENVSIADITTAAGQKNGAAIHYHFGGRDGLLDAIVDRHQQRLDRVRAERLASLEAGETEPGLRDLLRVVVEPMIDCLSIESGRAFLKIQAARTAEHGGVIAQPSVAMTDLRRRIDALLPPIPTVQRRERARLTSLIVNARLGERADEEARGARQPSRAALGTALIDAVEAILSSPGSSSPP